uniref:Beta-defensin-like domain-containing protein n=1 Tax=Equus asinus TaxID=9793 RepID=A0A8C4PUY0_EQUAS
MRIHFLFLMLLFFFLMPVPGNGGIINALQKSYWKIRNGQCAVLGCLPKEEQIGCCSVSGERNK